MKMYIYLYHSILLVYSSCLFDPLNKQVLSVSLKAPLSGQRHGLLRAFRPLFARYHEALRIHSALDGKNKKAGVKEEEAEREAVGMEKADGPSPRSPGSCVRCVG